MIIPSWRTGYAFDRTARSPGLAGSRISFTQSILSLSTNVHVILGIPGILKQCILSHYLIGMYAPWTMALQKHLIKPIV